MVDTEMHFDPETGDTYFLAPLSPTLMQLVDELEAATLWMAQRGEEEQNLPMFDGPPVVIVGGAEFDLDFSASFDRPRAN